MIMAARPPVAAAAKTNSPAAPTTTDGTPPPAGTVAPASAPVVGTTPPAVGSIPPLPRVSSGTPAKTGTVVSNEGTAGTTQPIPIPGTSSRKPPSGKKSPSASPPGSQPSSQPGSRTNSRAATPSRARAGSRGSPTKTPSRSPSVSPTGSPFRLGSPLLSAAAELSIDIDGLGTAASATSSASSGGRERPVLASAIRVRSRRNRLKKVLVLNEDQERERLTAPLILKSLIDELIAEINRLRTDQAHELHLNRADGWLRHLIPKIDREVRRAAKKIGELDSDEYLATQVRAVLPDCGHDPADSEYIVRKYLEFRRWTGTKENFFRYCDGDIKRLFEDHFETEKQLKELQDLVDREKKSKEEVLAENLRRFEEFRKELEAARMALETARLKADGDSAQLRAEIDRLIQERKVAEETARKQKESELFGQIQEIRVRVEKANEIAAAHKATIDCREKHIEKLEKELAKVMGDNTALTSKNVELEKEKKRVLEETEVARKAQEERHAAEIQSLTAKYAKMESERIATIEQGKEAARAALEKAKATEEESKRKIERVSQVHDQLSRKLHEANERFQKELTTLRQTKQENDEEFRTLKAKLTSVEGELKEEREKIGSLVDAKNSAEEATKKAAEAARSAVADGVRAAEAARDAAITDRDNLALEIAELVATIKARNERIEICDATILDRDTRLEQFSLMIRAHEATIARYTGVGASAAARGAAEATRDDSDAKLNAERKKGNEARERATGLTGDTNILTARGIASAGVAALVVTAPDGSVNVARTKATAASNN